MVYFIQDSLTFRIKIGFTGKDDPIQRLKDLQTGNSSLLYLLATRPGDKKTEGELHQQFSQYHVKDEWFNPGPELIQYIVGCVAVDMAQQAVTQAVKALAEQSFPETKAEAEARAIITAAKTRASAESRAREEQAKSLQLWSKLLESLPPLQANELRKARAFMSGHQLTISFPAELAQEHRYCSEHSRRSRINQVLLGLTGRPWLVLIELQSPHA